MTSTEATPLLVATATSTASTGTPLSRPSLSPPQQLSQQPLRDLQRARYCLYTSHFFAQFSQQSWEFSLTLFLAAYTNYENVILVSSYGIVTGLLICTMGSSVGRHFVDNTQWDRLSSTRCLVWTQNGCVILATLLSFALLLLQQSTSQSSSSSSSSPPQSDTQNTLNHMDPTSLILMVGLHIFGPLSTMLDKAFLVSIERDWVVVMGEYARDNHHKEATTATNTTTWLYETNVTMKQIDLGCRIAAPALAGLMIGMVEESFRNSHSSNITVTVADVTSLTNTNNYVNHHITSNAHLAYTALFIGLLNGLALVVEYICTFMIYRLIPPLSMKKHSYSSSVNTATMTTHTITPYETSKEHNDQPKQQYFTYWMVEFCGQRLAAPSGLRLYLTQPISWAGISLSLL